MKVIFAISLLMFSVVALSQTPTNLNDIVKTYMGETYSYQVDDYISKLPVYDQSTFVIKGDLKSDFKDVVVCADVYEEGVNDGTGYVGLLAGVKVEPGDVLEVNNSSEYDCEYGYSRFGLFDVQFNKCPDGKNKDVYSIGETNSTSTHFLIMFSSSATVYIPIIGCTYRDPACAVASDDDKTSVDMSFHRFREIVSYSVTLPSVTVPYSPSVLLNATVKAYDKHGVEVDILNNSTEQWSVSGDIATFTPVYNCTFKHDNVTQIGGYVKANGELAVVNLKNGEVTTAASEVVASSIQISASDGSLSVAGTDGQPYQVYALSGQKVYDGADAKVALPAGIYVVRFNGESVKAVVR